MSQLTKMGTKIKNLDVFGKVCEDLGLMFDKSSLNITDTLTRGHFKLIQEEDGSYVVYADADLNYNPIGKRLPRGMNSVLRGYSQAIIEEAYISNGGSIEEVVEGDDGSLTLSIAVGY